MDHSQWEISQFLWPCSIVTWFFRRVCFLFLHLLRASFLKHSPCFSGSLCAALVTAIATGWQLVKFHKFATGGPTSCPMCYHMYTVYTVYTVLQYVFIIIYNYVIYYVHLYVHIHAHIHIWIQQSIRTSFHTPFSRKRGIMKIGGNSARQAKDFRWVKHCTWPKIDSTVMALWPESYQLYQL